MSFYTVFVALAAFFWGVAGGLGGMLIADGWSPYVVALCRGGVGLLFVFSWLMWRSQKSGLRSHWLWLWSVVAGLGVAGNFTFYFISIAHGSVAVAATLMYCAPVFVYLISFALGLERPSMIKFMAIAAVMVGIVLLTHVYTVGLSGLSLIGVGAGLMAGFSYAVFIFGFKYAAPHGSPQTILSIAFAVLVAVLIVPSDVSQAFKGLASTDWLLFAALGVLGGGLSFVLYIIGLNYTAPAMAAIVAMVEPVTATLFSVLLLDELLATMQLVGMGIILLTVTALSVSASKPGASSSTPGGSSKAPARQRRA